MTNQINQIASSEDTLRSILNCSNNGIIALRAVRNTEGIIDFEYTLVNDAAQRILEKTEHELIGNRLLTLFPKSLEYGIFDNYKRIVDEDINYQNEHQYVDKDLHRWFRTSGKKLNDGLVLIFEDISEGKKMHANVMRIEKLSTTGKILRILAHEIRNPLTNLNLALNQIKDDMKPNEEDEVFFEICTNNIERINKLISQMANTSRPKLVSLKPANINEVIDSAVELVKDRILLRDIDLSIELDQTCPMVMLDFVLTQTAVVNLMVNAIEAMVDTKDKKLIVKTQDTKEGFSIFIRDTGKGMDDETARKIFDPFYSQKKKGLGLGLTGVQTIVHSHKGHVEVKSEIGKGTEFKLTFPIL